MMAHSPALLDHREPEPSADQKGITYILLDSGSDEHVCQLQFAKNAPARAGDDDEGPLVDVQGNAMPVTETRDVEMQVDTDSGWVETAVTFKAGPFLEEPLVHRQVDGARLQTPHVGGRLLP